MDVTEESIVGKTLREISDRVKAALEFVTESVGGGKSLYEIEQGVLGQVLELGRQLFDKWYGWACRSRLKPIIKTTKMLKRHLANLLTNTKHKITNSMAEGFNSKIQSIKSSARGFRSFENYRTRILFFCGKLNLLSSEVSHYFP